MSEGNSKNDLIKTIYKFDIQDGSRKRTFGLLKPTRRVRQDGELFYSSQLSKYISAGVLPRAILEKIIKNNGGSISEPDKEKYSELYNELIGLNKKLNELVSDIEKKKENEEEIKKVQSQIISVRRAMQDLENEQSYIYENTAEAKARNQSSLWWFFKIAVEIFDDGKRSSHVIPQEISFEKQLDFFDEILERDDDDFDKKIFSRLNYLATVWFLGAASEESEFKYFDDDYEERVRRGGKKSDESASANKEESQHSLDEKGEEQNLPE